MRKGFKTFILALALVFMGAFTAQAVNLEVHGQFGNKIQTTNSTGLITGKTAADQLNNKDLDDTWGELQFRLWTVASSDDGNVKGVWAMEVGTATYGDTTLGFATNATEIENRMMYVDFQLPWFASSNRLAVGLQWVTINPWLWDETAAGIRNYGSFDLGGTAFAYQIGWMRDDDNSEVRKNDIATPATGNNNDSDYWFARVDFAPKGLPVENLNVGLFAVYNMDATVDQNVWSLGIDGGFAVSGVDVGLNLIYQTGDDDANNKDISAWFFEGSLGYKVTEQMKVAFEFWYASGDDNPNDGDIENYQAIEMHTMGSVVLFEDATFDDGSYVSRNPYLNSLGFIMYRLRADYQATPKLALCAAVNYMQYAEDASNGEDTLGWEIDFYADYELYKGLKLNLAAGYLFADDALDAYGTSPADADDMYRVSAGVTFEF